MGVVHNDGIFIAEVDITAAALEKLAALLANKEEAMCFRAQIIGGGCQGLSYSFSLDVRDEEDFFKTFPEPALVKLVVDSLSYPYYKGAVIDYVIDETGETFTVKNPNARVQCSCGSSFSTGD